MSTQIPATHDDAIAALVALDCARWGEHEREASERLYRRHTRGSYGLALNSLARRPEYDFGDAVPSLVAAAKAAMTDDDHEYLRKLGAQ